MPKVSVIIPVYNCERHIREAITSVLAQTYKDYELIVIDDGSTDRSGRIVQEEFGETAKYYRQRNGGAARARNAGVQQSSGRLIAFLDADDIWLPEKLAIQVPILENRLEIGLVHCDVEGIDSSGRHVRVWRNSGRKDAYARQFLKGHIIAPYASLIRKDIFLKAGGFDEDFPVAGYEDLEFSIRIGQLCEIYCVDKPLVKHREWARTTGNVARSLANREIFLQKVIGRFGTRPGLKRFLYGEQARCYSDLGKFLVKEGQVHEGRRRLAESIRLGVRGWDLPIAVRSFCRLARSFV